MSAEPALTILIPAAGASRRMRGADKLLEPVAGHPMLRRQALIALAQSVPVIVTLRKDDGLRKATLMGLALECLTIDDAHLGMSASIRHAAARVKTALMILPADMPDLTQADLATMIAASDSMPDLILRGSAAGKPGHPVIFPARLIPDLIGLHGDEGAKSVIAAHPGAIRLIALPATHALTDLDTPEDWADWRGRQGRPAI